MFYFDIRYLIIVGPAILLAIIASAKVKAAFARYSRVPAASGFPGAEAAAQMLRSAGLPGVSIERVSGFLSDHYDPSKKVLRLSPEVYDARSLASVGVACHEAGHALQDARHYAPLVLRNAIVPTASIGSNLAFVLILIGLFIQAFHGLALIGLALFGTVVVFQIINLPVEFNASSRAKGMLVDLGIVQPGAEAAGVASVLNAAAMTYVAATLTAILQMLYFAMLVLGGGRRN
ncbi:MAG: zinc metallopeptidase [bacterium]|nr:zinc metallopeptidase [bacterium]